MAKPIPPSNVAIASLDARKQTMFNLMAPGPGTPWEDRGSIGTIGAFFKTAFKSMFKPAELLDSIRRPETAGDSFSFAIGCGMMWALSAVVHGWFYWKHLLNEETRTMGSGTEYRISVTGQPFWLWCGIAAIATVVGAVLFQKIGSKIYYSMVATEMKSKAPVVLAINIFGYALGPSLLAPIPFVGPILAIIWILMVLIVGGTTRMKIGLAGAITGSVVSMAVMLGACGAAWFFAKYIPPQPVIKEDPLPRGRSTS
jgi:hypothetical protein